MVAKTTSARKPRKTAPVKDMTPRKGTKAAGSATVSGNTIYVSGNGGVWKTT